MFQPWLSPSEFVVIPLLFIMLADGPWLVSGPFIVPHKTKWEHSGILPKYIFQHLLWWDLVTHWVVCMWVHVWKGWDGKQGAELRWSQDPEVLDGWWIPVCHWRLQQDTERNLASVRFILVPWITEIYGKNPALLINWLMAWFGHSFSCLSHFIY